MIHCLTIPEYKELINANFWNKKIASEYEYIQDLFESSKYWENGILAINYFLSIAIEKFSKKNNISQELINYIYALELDRYFMIQEIDVDFIKYLYSNYVTNDSTELSDELIEIQKTLYG